MNKESKNTDHVYGYVLEVLTTGLYPNNLDVIREYIQNGYDAIKSLRELGVHGSEEVYINIEDNQIIIHDSGIGMDKETVEKYRYFGYSEKITSKNTGFRGIGKLAGLSVANELEVITSKYNIPYQYRVKFSAAQMLNQIIEGKKIGENYPLNDLINKYTTIEEYPDTLDSHYTKVILHDIKENANELLDFETLKNHLGQVMPVEFNKKSFKLGETISKKILENVKNHWLIDIYLNGEKIYKPYGDLDELSGLFFYPIYKDENTKEELLAYAWVLKNGKNSKAITNDSVKNIRAIYKGFMIGNKELLSNVLFSQGRQFTAAWFAGEIYIVDEELIPTSARDNFESNEARRNLFLQLREQLGRKLDKTANDTSKINSLIKEKEKTKDEIAKIDKLIKDKIPKEIIEQKEKEIELKKRALEKRIKETKNVIPKSLVQETNKMIQEIDKVKDQIEKIKNKEENIVEINFSPSEKQIYEIFTKSIKNFFIKNDLENEEELISHVYQKLLKVFGTKSVK